VVTAVKRLPRQRGEPIESATFLADLFQKPLSHWLLQHSAQVGRMLLREQAHPRIGNASIQVGND
jgi:hypothetical protein